MLTRERKEKIVSSLQKDFDNSKAFFLTNLIGITANESVELRKKIREANGKIVVARNTLFRKASEGREFAEKLSNLKGPNAIAFAFDEAPAVAKAVYDAEKDLEAVDLKFGFFEGKELELADVVALAKLPSRDQMLATLLATFNAPISAFARVLHQINEQKESGAEPAPTAEAAPATEEEKKTEE